MIKRNKLERYVLRGQISLSGGPIFILIIILLILLYINIIDLKNFVVFVGLFSIAYTIFSIAVALSIYLYIIRKHGDFYIPDYYNIDYIIGCRIVKIIYIKKDDIDEIIEKTYYHKIFHNQYLIKICLKKGICFAEAPFSNKDLKNSILITIDDNDYQMLKYHFIEKLKT